MTLPSRKKLRITVLNIRSRVKALKRQARRGLLTAALISSSAGPLFAQSPAWQPSRLPPAPTIQPLHAANASPAASGAARTSAAAGTRGSAGASSGVHLRWRASSRALGGSQAAAPHVGSASEVYHQASAAQTGATNAAPTRAQAAAAASGDQRSGHLANEAWLANPLRDSQPAQPQSVQTYAVSRRLSDDDASAHATRPAGGAPRGDAHSTSVRLAAYQFPAGGAQGQTGTQAESSSLPTLDDSGSSRTQFQPPTLPQSPLQPMPSNDPLSQAELPPPPPAGSNAAGLELPGAAQAQPSGRPAEPSLPELGAPSADGQVTPFNRDLPGAQDNLSPSDRGGLPDSAQGKDQPEEFDQLGRRKTRPDSSANCETFRDNLRKATLDKINLNSAPRYGQGLGVDPQEAEKMRQDFASTSEVREWCDRDGRTLVRGRMVDLRNEQVVLDIDGARRTIPLRDLCDVDMAYIGKAWNLPISCGSGYQVVAGRDFVPSAMQWKASGLCHKPLYFEEVQLERYGHEIGPLLQPVVSTVHFFGNIAVLPYKMGIHPPHECQHALGYYRPGDCAPYMLPPIPISLRGAAVQAGTVVGASALIP